MLTINIAHNTSEQDRSNTYLDSNHKLLMRDTHRVICVELVKEVYKTKVVFLNVVPQFDHGMNSSSWSQWTAICTLQKPDCWQPLTQS